MPYETTHFTKRKFLEGIGKSLFQELFIATDSTGSALTSTLLPDLPDKDYFDTVAKLAINPEQLPHSIRCSLGGAERLIEPCDMWLKLRLKSTSELDKENPTGSKKSVV